MKTISIQQKYKEQAKMLVALEMEVKDLRAKAEAWDKGQEAFAGEKPALATNEK